eukprot:COSAG02_NODE_24788_length_677_cov_1.621107_1_plen_117_part_00
MKNCPLAMLTLEDVSTVRTSSTPTVVLVLSHYGHIVCWCARTFGSGEQDNVYIMHVIFEWYSTLMFTMRCATTIMSKTTVVSGEKADLFMTSRGRGRERWESLVSWPLGSYRVHVQ